MNKYDLTITKLHQMVKEGIVPGVSYLIFDRQHTIKEVTGMAQVYPETERLKPDMLYDVASLTKVIGTVPVIAMLIQKGALALDDPIKKFLPKFNDDRPTIRNLLTHTSGIAGYIPHRNELDAVELKKAFLTKMHVEDSLNRQIKYADVNYLYLGWIIERIYNQPVQKVIAEQVLKPLKMPTATFRPQPANCVPTEVQEKRGLIRGETHDPKGYILGENCGCAGLFASLKDLEIFSHALIENNLNGLLTSETTKLLFTDQTRISGPHSRSLGWKLFHAKDRHLLISHTGFTGTWMVLDRQTDQGFIVLTNRVHPSAKNQEYLDARDQLFAIYLKEKEKTL
ncbi:beta-lactamase family protein [Limosilactobacillus reuteri]|uniref:serine hydrolase domain-containing protein n=1 Tax=Limosilactobacillus reuteri TaxID=1598 RepID=UPI001E2FE776|nr:beta-lactamase family protein [Limosilactobacillus reuteri]MCC4325042.1 beta-lactamase family protein [Limosilactobacillus reuteri]MCC4330349.1 beta-lactamase family protein [Limosilactobacillus reuteri]MCC4351898.1 beta-lactamase family protein [Limosilactobacillus reuteri]MCC4376607.1 beta-lactamase family protein [Limosilactobacillus reuteri]